MAGCTAPGSAGRRPFGLRLHLAGILLAALLPALAAGGLALHSAAGAYQHAFEARLRDTARALSLAIDADISGRVAVADRLRHLPRLRRRHPHRRPGRRPCPCRPGRRRHRHAHRGGRCRDGSFLLHHQVAPGAPLPETGGAAGVLRAAIPQERPVVSDLMPGPVVQRPVVAVVVPVPRADGEPPVLSAGGSLDPEHYDAMLAAQRLEAGAFASA